MAENLESRPDRPSKLTRLWKRVRARGLTGIATGAVKQDVADLLYEDEAVEFQKRLEKARGDLGKIRRLKKERAWQDAPDTGYLTRRDFLKLAVGWGLLSGSTALARFLWSKGTSIQKEGKIEIGGKTINLVERGRRVDANTAAWASLLQPKAAYILGVSVAQFGSPLREGNLNDPDTWLGDKRLEILAERMEGLENFFLALRTEDSRQGFRDFLQKKSLALEKGGIGVDYTPGLAKLNQYALEMGIKEMGWEYLGAYFQTTVENGGLGWNDDDWFLLEQVMGRFITSGRENEVFMGKTFTVAELKDLALVVNNYNDKYAPSGSLAPRLTPSR